MSLIKQENGRISLENRECVFKNGKPVNMPYWDYFKTSIKELKTHSYESCVPPRRLKITEELIYQTFNEIIDAFTEITLHTSFDRFIIFCGEQNLKFERNVQDCSVTIYENFQEKE